MPAAASRIRAISVAGDDLAVRVSTDEDPAEDAPILLPSLGEYPVYGDFSYEYMIADKLRTDAYRAAVRALAPGKVVLDIGTGQDALWAVTAANAGAARVYAIEVIPEAADQARRTVEAAGLAGKITILDGLSAEIELPERVDVLVSEIIGAIGGSEGAEYVLDDARRRFLKPGGDSIPHRCVTTVAAVDTSTVLPDGELAFSPLFLPDLEQIFASVGHPFDLRLCLLGLDQAEFLSPRAEVEELRFTAPMAGNGTDRVELPVTKAGRLHGLALGIRLWITGEEDQPIDSLAQQTSWCPIYVPLSLEGIAVARGDRITLELRRSLSDDGVHPDYELTGRILRAGRSTVDISWHSPHHGTTFRGSAPYRLLFPAQD
ncbi:50S ribosomal protein L11 methyltransferase [Amycolatopsis sp. NPDC059021]|uniref:50S ribosomal protein L11 methyltransferase n=1 Tax=Amycolatopsis sp. NPDC059021 TaxID=3346704 RepID=UPI003670DA7D